MLSEIENQHPRNSAQHLSASDSKLAAVAGPSGSAVQLFECDNCESVISLAVDGEVAFMRMFGKSLLRGVTCRECRGLSGEGAHSGRGYIELDVEGCTLSLLPAYALLREAYRGFKGMRFGVENLVFADPIPIAAKHGNVFYPALLLGVDFNGCVKKSSFSSPVERPSFSKVVCFVTVCSSTLTKKSDVTWKEWRVSASQIVIPENWSAFAEHPMLGASHSSAGELAKAKVEWQTAERMGLLQTPPRVAENALRNVVDGILKDLTNVTSRLETEIVGSFTSTLTKRKFVNVYGNGSTSASWDDELLQDPTRETVGHVEGSSSVGEKRDEVKENSAEAMSARLGVKLLDVVWVRPGRAWRLASTPNEASHVEQLSRLWLPGVVIGSAMIHESTGEYVVCLWDTINTSRVSLMVKGSELKPWNESNLTKYSKEAECFAPTSVLHLVMECISLAKYMAEKSTAVPDWITAHAEAFARSQSHLVDQRSSISLVKSALALHHLKAFLASNMITMHWRTIEYARQFVRAVEDKKYGGYHLIASQDWPTDLEVDSGKRQEVYLMYPGDVLTADEAKNLERSHDQGLESELAATSVGRIRGLDKIHVDRNRYVAEIPNTLEILDKSGKCNLNSTGHNFFVDGLQYSDPNSLIWAPGPTVNHEREIYCKLEPRHSLETGMRGFWLQRKRGKVIRAGEPLYWSYDGGAGKFDQDYGLEGKPAPDGWIG